MRKIFVCFLLISSVVFSLGPAVLAYTSVSTYIDGALLRTENEPYLLNGDVYVPISDLGRAIGAKISWDDKLHKAIFKLSDTEIFLFANSNIAYVNGARVNIGGKTFTKNGRIMAPANFILDSINAEYTYDNKLNRLDISFGIRVLSVDVAETSYFTKSSYIPIPSGYNKVLNETIKSLQKMADLEGVIFKPVEPVDISVIDEYYKILSGEVGSLPDSISKEHKARSELFNSMLGPAGFSVDYRPVNFYQYGKSTIVFGVDNVCAPDLGSFLHYFMDKIEETGYYFKEHQAVTSLYDRYKNIKGGLAIYIIDNENLSVYKLMGE